MGHQISTFTQQRCPELAAFLEACSTTPLAFEGDHPIAHSGDNHIHLWALEYWADHHAWIDLEYRVEFAEQILTRWRGRLRGLPPYRNAGFRLYLYEDLAPTVSIVAETTYGFPYGGEPSMVDTVRDVMALYVGRSWRDNFDFAPWEVEPGRILATVEQHSGSISKPTANALGMQVGKLRILIEQMGIDIQINDIRKRFRRRPAKFRSEEDLPHRYRIYEQRLPAAFR